MWGVMNDSTGYSKRGDEIELKINIIVNVILICRYVLKHRDLIDKDISNFD